MIALALVGCSSDDGEQAEAPEVSPRAISLMEQAQRALQQGDMRQALALTDSAARHAPEQTDLHFMRGNLLTRLNRLPEAGEAYQRVVDLNAGYPAGWYKLGNNALQRDHYREALQFYERERARLEKEPSEGKEAMPAVLLQIGRTYLRLGEPDSARQAYQRALEHDRFFARAYSDLGQLYRNEGRFETALGHSRRALELEPDNVEYRYVVGSLLLRAGRVEQASKTLKQVIRQQAWHQGAHYKLGQALAQMGQAEEAQRYLDRADTLQALRHQIAQERTSLRLDAANPQRWMKLAQLQNRTGRYTDAAKSYRSALQLAPESTDAWAGLGETYAGLGRVADARKAWQRALQLDPDRADVRSMLSELDASRD